MKISELIIVIHKLSFNMYTFVHHMQIIKCCILEIIEWNTSSAPCCFDQSRLEHSCLPRLWDKVFRVSNYRKDHGRRRLNRFLDFIPCTFNSNQILTQIDVYVKLIDDVIIATLRNDQGNTILVIKKNDTLL